jgi:hypothetical protein
MRNHWYAYLHSQRRTHHYAIFDEIPLDWPELDSALDLLAEDQERLEPRPEAGSEPKPDPA